MATKALTVDARQLEAFANGLESAAGEALGKQVVTALNDVVDRTYDLARNRINAGINLTDDYVRRKISVRHATPGRPVAEIVAPGDKSANVPLRNYDAQMLLAPSKKPAGLQGPRRMPVPFGKKQRGVTVQVTKGNQTTLERGFMLPLRRGTEAGGNGLGVFLRTKDGRLRHRYGPAVYQLFKHQIEETPFVSEVEDDLEATLVQYAENEFQKAIR